ncbi:MAG: calcium-binding protein, partial [Ilumatobacteraceae bacterium]
AVSGTPFSIPHEVTEVKNVEDVVGTSFNDNIIGSSDDNRLDGGAGDDKIHAGDGNDTLIGGTGNNLLDGGNGSDTADYSSAQHLVFADLATGGGVQLDSSYNVVAQDTYVSIENLTGSSHDDILIGDTNANVINGGDGNDVVQGGSGGDTLHGGNGDDIINGGSGDDTVTGDAGNDTLIYTLSENIGATDNYDGGTGTDTLVLRLTQAQANMAAADIAAAQAFIAAHYDPNISTGPSFTFSTFGLTFSNIEAIQVVITGP